MNASNRPLILVLGTTEECFLINRVLEPIEDSAEILFERYPPRDGRSVGQGFAARQTQLVQRMFSLAECCIPDLVVGGIIGEKGKDFRSSWPFVHGIQRACQQSNLIPMPWFLCTYFPGMRFGRMPPAFEKALHDVPTPDEDPMRRTVCYVPHNELVKVIGHLLGW